MTYQNAGDEQKRASIGDVFDRLDTLLRPSAAGSFSAKEAPLTAVLRAAGKPFGAKPTPGIAPSSMETGGEALIRIARSANLIARQTTLERDWKRSAPLPIIAFRKSDGGPIALVPKGTGWMYVDGDRPKEPVRLVPSMIGELDDAAYIISPAFPETAMKPRDLFLFAMGTKTPDLAVFAITSILAGWALAGIPMANMAVTDIIIPGRDIPLLQHIAGMLVAIVLITLATRLMGALSQLRIDGRTGSMLRAAAADRIIRSANGPDAKPMAPPTAALIARSIEGWHRGTWGMVMNVVSGVLLAIPSLLLMTRMSPPAAGVLLIIMLASIVVSWLVARRQLEALFTGPSSPTSWISSSFEALNHIVTVRAYGAEQRFFRQFCDSFLALKDKFLVSDRMGALVHTLAHVMEAVIMTAAIIVVVVFNKDLQSGDSVALTMAIMTVAGANIAIVNAFTQTSMLGLQQRMIEPVLKGIPAKANQGGVPGKLAGHIRIQGATVRPIKFGPAILDGINMNIEPGQHIGIAGPSGSGKSSLLKVVSGLSGLDAGRVLFDGLDLSTLDSAAVRRQIGMVGQAGRVLSGTIAHNVSAGLILNDEQIWSALRTAAFEDEVRAFPLGLATPVGEGETLLSAGQIQRLLIARAVAQKPAVMLLDEATSALDPTTESAVAKAIDGLHATVISVAHRLDTLRNCDVIHVIDAGRIVESGTYDELADNGGLFAQMLAADHQVTRAPAGALTASARRTPAPAPRPAADGSNAPAKPVKIRRSAMDVMAQLEKLKDSYRT